MLDMYDFNNDVWLCHSFRGNCYNYTAFTPATNVLTEVRVFLEANPSEIITVIIEDYVRSPNGLTRAFNASGLMRFWFPVSRMPRNGQDWPTVDDMVQNNQRLVVFTSRASKESSERIAYQWRYMVENQYGDSGMRAGSCPNRSESPAMNTTTRSLVLMNYFPSTPSLTQSCRHNSAPLISMMNTCYEVAGRRWPNFIAVDYYRVFCCLRKSYADKLVQDLTRPVFSSMNLYLDTLILQRSDGGGAPQAVDTANGQLVCGCANIASCRENMTFGACEVAGDIAPSGEFNNQTSLGQFDSRPIRFQWLIGVFLMAGMSL
ncbi:PI-PLC X domain-containing At5g67130-like isoform X1 [Olea europaea subsp. europaea]|nr:PI-PLC X domain-containing At5g67130-like isoform X1 [Olea europaea subsp. europaea]